VTAKAIVEDSTGLVLYVGSSSSLADVDLTGRTMVDFIGNDEDKIRRMYYDFDLDEFSFDLDIVRQDKKDELTAYREEVVLESVETTFGTFFTDNSSRGILVGQILSLWVMEKLGLTLPDDIEFKTAEGWQTFARTDFLAASLEVLAGIKEVFDHQRELEDLADGSDDVGEIQNLEWDSV
jgi:hypothetical protein